MDVWQWLERHDKDIKELRTQRGTVYTPPTSDAVEREVEKLKRRVEELFGLIQQYVRKEIIIIKGEGRKEEKMTDEPISKEYCLEFLVPVIISTTEHHFHARVHTNNRKQDVAAARQVAAFLIREMTPLTYPEIARVLGKKNHTTILYAYNKIDKRIKDNPKFGHLVKSIKDEVTKLRGEVREKPSEVDMLVTRP